MVDAERREPASGVLLFLASAALLIALAYANRIDIVAALERRSIPGFVLHICTGVWLFVGIPLIWRLFAQVRRREAPASADGVVISVAFFALSLFAFAQYMFRSPSFPLIFLLLASGPLVILLEWLLGRRPRGHLTARMRRTILNASLVLTTLTLTMILIEGGFRMLTGHQPGGYDAYGTRADFALLPFVMFGEPAVSDGGKVNAQGFVGDLVQVPKAPRTLRIAILGGSAVWAGGARTSIAAYLRDILAEANPAEHVEVVNFGRQGYVSMQELILLQRCVLPLQFDVIIIYDGYNDLWIPYAAEPLGVGYPYLYSNMKTRVEDSRLFNISYMFNTLAKRSALVNALRHEREAHVRATKERFDIEACRQEYGRNLYQMGLLGASYGAKVLVSTQPFVGTKEPRVGDEIEYLEPGELSRVTTFYNEMAAASREAASRASATYVEGLDIFDGVEREVFSDPVHVHAEIGNPLIAATLARAVSKVLPREPGEP